MVLALASLLLAQGPTLPPVDESPRDPSLAAFLNNFRRAVKERDAQGVLVRLDPKIRTSFGGDGGMAAFRKSWRPEQRTSALWKELDAILKLGGTFRDGGFWMPTAYAKWPDAYDAFSYGVTGPSVPIYSKPSLGATRVATLNYGIVEVGIGKEGWVPVVKPKGFIQVGDLRRPIDYRMGISKHGGRWLVDALVTGD